MKTFATFLCPFLLALAASGAPPDNPTTSPPLTLSAATENALTNNPSIREARAKWEALKARVAQASAWDDLKISAQTRLARFVDVPENAFADQMVGVEQVIPISGRNESRARIATAEAVQGMEEVRRTELDVVMKVRLAYVQLVNGFAQLELNRANASSLHQTVDISQSQFGVGGQTEADVLTAESEVIRIEDDRHDLERGISDAKTQLKVLMNRDAFAPIGRPADELHGGEIPPVETLRGLMLNNRPELRMARANVTAAKARLELAKREWIPDPAISVQAQRYNEAPQAVSEADAGISFTVPWLNETKYRAEEREAQADVDAAKQGFEAERADALGMLRDQLEKIQTLQHHIQHFRDRLIPAAEKSVETERAGYQAGKSGFLELITSERNLREVESMHQQHIADYQTALAELEALVGVNLNLFPSEPNTK